MKSATRPRSRPAIGFHGASNRQGGLEQAKREYLDEVVEHAKARAAEEGLNLELFEQHLRQLGLF